MKLKRILRQLLLSGFVLCSVIAKAQSVDQDSLLVPIIESRNDSVDLASGFYDIIDSLSEFFPSSTVYESWDNEYIHYPKVDFSEKEDTTMLILCDQHSTFYTHPRKGRINSNYGYRKRRFHTGIDVDLEIGDSIVSAFDGVVRISNYHKGYGNVLVLRHYNGLETIYAHLSVSRAVINQTVKSGELIGFGGSTGRSTGPHLHFEVRYLGTPMDPRKVIDFEANKLLSDTLLVSKYLFGNPSKTPQYTTTTTTTTTTQTSNQTVYKGNAVYHTVRSGETLSHIAAKYGTSISTICKLSGISATGILQIGQKVRVK